MTRIYAEANAPGRPNKDEQIIGTDLSHIQKAWIADSTPTGVRTICLIELT
jgi:hypothetical protein